MLSRQLGGSRERRVDGREGANGGRQGFVRSSPVEIERRLSRDVSIGSQGGGSLDSLDQSHGRIRASSSVSDSASRRDRLGADGSVDSRTAGSWGGRNRKGRAANGAAQRFDETGSNFAVVTGCGGASQRDISAANGAIGGDAGRADEIAATGNADSSAGKANAVHPPLARAGSEVTVTETYRAGAGPEKSPGDSSEPTCTPPLGLAQLSERDSESGLSSALPKEAAPLPSEGGGFGSTASISGASLNGGSSNAPGSGGSTTASDTGGSSGVPPAVPAAGGLARRRSSAEESSHGDGNGGRRMQKRVSFSDTAEEPFTPSYARFTPHLPAGGVKYRALEKRVPAAVAPPSTLARPNYHDALRRVSIVVYNHILHCERRWHRMRRAQAEQRSREAAAAASAAQAAGPPRGPFGLPWFGRPARPDPKAKAPLPDPAIAAAAAVAAAAATAAEVADGRAVPGEGFKNGGGGLGSGGGSGRNVGEGIDLPLDAAKEELFHEKRYMAPQYKYTFLRAPMLGLPGAPYTLQKIDTEPQMPKVDTIYEFIRTLFTKACLSSECSIVCLIYVERLMEVASVPLLRTTWRPILLCGLLLASKVWQDLSSWNVEFSQVYPEFTLQNINRLEKTFITQLSWNMHIEGSLYAKYYFALRSATEKEDFRRKYNFIVQVDVPRANVVAERSEAVKVEIAKLFSKSL